MGRTILALDQASKDSGWSVFTDGKLEAYGVIHANQNNIGERLVYIRKEVKTLLDTYTPDMVLMEDIQMQAGNVVAYKALAEVFGVIEELLTEEEYPHDAVLAGTWKSTLGIKGKKREEQKANAALYVLNKYKISPTQDAVDAICINEHYDLLMNKKDGRSWS